MATAVPEGNLSKEETNPLWHSIIVVIAGLIAVQLAQPQTLGAIPFRNLLKNEIHIDRTGNAAFFFWIGLAWYFKPFAGIFTDAFPLLGTRRRSYILMATSVAIFFWIVLIFTPHQYGKLLRVTLLVDLFMMITSTVVGGYMVETAQRLSGTGRFASLFTVISYSAFMLSGLIGGYLASKPFGLTPLTSALLMFPVIPAAFFLLREKKQIVKSGEMLKNAANQFVNIGKARTMWAAAGLMALFYMAPGFQTAVFYRQQDVLHMDTQGQGSLMFLQGVGAVLAALWYGFACKRIKLRNLLLLGLSAATIVCLGYLFYTSVAHARIVETTYWFGFTMAECSLMDLAMRATPKGSEALGFSLMMSVRNFGLYGSDIFGSWLLDKYHIPFNALVFSNSVTTAIAVPLVLLLPLYMVSNKDADNSVEASVSKLVPQE